MKNAVLFLFLLSFCTLEAQTALVPMGASWKYLDDGSDQGTAWQDSAFNDASWMSGNAQLGYGDGDETTVVSYGPSSSNKYVTTYFRKSISIANVSLYAFYTLNVKRDDGIVVYVNGVEQYRNNIPSGTVTYTTLASSASDDGNGIQTAALPPGTFVNGNNVIAVEIHQTSINSSDISFDLSLTGNPSSSVSLTRGPYLQMGTSSGMTIRWQTSTPCNSQVTYGSSPANLTLSVIDNTFVTDHTVRITGLAPDTKYYYAIGSSAQTLQASAGNYFVTSPTTGTEKKTRIWVTGDCGNNSTNQANVRNQYTNYIDTNNTDVWMLLGDNAYNGGLDNEYQSKFFNVYGAMLQHTVLWPAPGNHDYNNNSSNQDTHNIPYYSIFSLPDSAQAGGIASGTEAFYSYDYANIHFVVLDSYGKESNQYRLYDTLGPQAVWLKQDLAANTQRWTIVYFHHPPYTMGSHNSDTESELVNIRQKLLRILERYKVDLVICGHSHVYERSRLMEGYYGSETTFNTSFNLSSSSAKYDGSASSCPYNKTAFSSYSGTVYVVAGSAGQLGGTETAWPHNAMYYSNATNGGSLAITVEGNRLDAKWICADGTTRDNFTIMKDVNNTSTISITASQGVTLTASWIGTYSWNTGDTTRSITVSPLVNTTYTVTDQIGCITDVFNIIVTPTGETDFVPDRLMLSVEPNPASDKTIIEYSTPFVGDVRLDLYDINGKLVKSLVDQSLDNGQYRYELNAKAESILPGMYFVYLTFGEQQVMQKLMIVNE